MLPETRHRKILEIINQNGSVIVQELARLFQVVPITIRRDLERLEKEGLLVRIHGGAVANPEPVVAKSLNTKVSLNQEAKARIGAKAAAMVQAGETVILDEGSTCLEIAKSLTRHSDITVVTNGLRVAYELTPYTNITTILIGGVVGHNNFVAYGHDTLNSFSKMRAHRYFMGIDAIQVGFGISDADPHQVQLKLAKVAAAQEVIGVADNSKLGKIGVVHVADLGILDKLIMNDPVSGSFRTALERERVQLIEAN